jgi:hypothetical protein
MKGLTLGYVLAAAAVWCGVAFTVLAKPPPAAQERRLACLR